MDLYLPEAEERMRCFYLSLNEKERRLYAGLEALRIGHGGRNHIADVLGCSRNTVSKGACEISSLPKQQVEQCIRQSGGGRKSYEVKERGLNKLCIIASFFCLYSVEWHQVHSKLRNGCYTSEDRQKSK